MRSRVIHLAAGSLLAFAAGTAAAQVLDSTTAAAFRWRSIGPANMMGRITDIEGIPSPSKTFYVAAAAGGIWKTTNNGTTFRPIFDRERCISMGDLAIAPSDTNVVYAGTGEEDSRNSISPGCGLLKSTDGGLTWKHMGLDKTQAIGRIIVHPKNPNTVWVAALGAIWNSNPERGIYKTTDGGQTWKLVKFISDKAGFVDVAMDSRNPDVLWAASWERVRGPYFLKSGGPGSALWKSTDGGESWTQIKGGGFPETTIGRIGIAIAPSNGDYIYLMLEADTVPNAVKGKARQTMPSGLWRTTDGGKTWEKRNANNVRPFYYSQVRVDPKNPERVYWSSTPVNVSDDGGKTIRNATQGLHVDHHAMWIDPNDADRFVVGNDGGIAITFDKGGNYDFANIFAVGQFYNVSYDMAIPYRVCGGLQDNGSWCGPSRRRQGAIINALWFNVGGGDGFHTAQDPTDPNFVFAESQGGAIGRLNVQTGERAQLVKPNWRPLYRQYEDSIILERGDTAKPETSAQKKRLTDLRTRAAADSTNLDLRWNWNTPFFLSPHNPQVLYAGANRVMKSTKRGDDMFPISPDLSTRDSAKIRVSMRETGGITLDATGAETYGTVVSLAESPSRSGLLVAGTDDGNVWLTRNDGGIWENLTGRFPGVPPKTYVSRIEPSRFDSATFYITFDNHRNGDFTPYAFVTTDFGKTFKSIVNNLPTGGPNFVHVLREDPENRDLLFVGTDVGVYVSTNRGQGWEKFMTGLPTVPVPDLKIHPREHELIAGTHGRSIWIVDIAPLEQMTTKVVAEGTHLFVPKTAYQYNDAPSSGAMGGGGGGGHHVFEAPSPQYGAEIAYRVVGGEPRAQAKIVITDAAGDTMRSLTGPGRTGIQRAYWDFRGKAPAAQPLSPAGRRDSTRLIARVNTVFDSLKAAGQDSSMLARVRTQMLSGEGFGAFGGGGGGGGGRGGEGQAFAARPGETSPPPAGRGGGAGGGPGAAGAPAAAAAPPAGGAGGAEPDPTFIFTVLQLLTPPGAGGGFGGAGALLGTLTGNRPPAPLVASGDYLVSVTVGGKTMRQTLRVERMPGVTNPTVFGTDGDAERAARKRMPNDR
jgi:photosystem II stability/assembly factor-like uncharacterized protein